MLKIWHSHLDELTKAHLAAPLPNTTEQLTEEMALCELRGRLLSNLAPSTQTTDSELDQEEIALTNMHNEALAKLMTRQEQIVTRINLWER